MTPTIFKCASGSHTSEADIAFGYNSLENSRVVLEQHWDSFVQESDFQYLAKIGINTVRLPIGYWCLPSGENATAGTLYESVASVYKNCWPRVSRSIKYAEHAGIGVLIDLHGAPGSQNGQQHSGVSDGRTSLFSNARYMDETTEILKRLAERLGGINNVVGLQLLNEPVYDNALEGFCESTTSTSLNHLKVCFTRHTSA